MADKKKQSKAEKKTATVMKEYKKGTLHSGKSGKIVTSREQAIAIAISEGKQAAKKK